MKPKRSWNIRIWFFLILLVGIGVYIFYTEVRPVVIFGLRDDYAHAIPYQQVPVGLQSLKAEECGRCHEEIYQEWKSSIHAQAFHDPFFQAYWKKDKNIWVCLNCHTPLENQQPTLVKDIPRGRVEKAFEIPNYRFDAEYQQEGVTCAACHVRDGMILGPYDDSVAPHPTNLILHFALHKSVIVVIAWFPVPRSFMRMLPVGHSLNMKVNFLLRRRADLSELSYAWKCSGLLLRESYSVWPSASLAGGHDPDMIKRAVAVQVQADPPSPQPGDDVTLTLTLIMLGRAIRFRRETLTGILRSNLKCAMLRERWFINKLIPWDGGFSGNPSFLRSMIIVYFRFSQPRLHI